ncbi:DUF3068 domain-containing protein [Corynebacterium pacaense]|uniref:DUF3068 domain-containing protein n=1 Tax=Corynebacterium pacaense TaxID=1816684 RepID=UPI0009BC0F68|nr:DUF3068 domain-containing protein [Corynebacterium pacaense]
MLPKTRIFSALLLGLGVALIVWGSVAPRFVHADGRLPVDLDATTYTLIDDTVLTRLNSEPGGRVLEVPVSHQIHFEVVDPVDAEHATLRVGDSFMRESYQQEQDRLISASIASLRVERFSGEIVSEVVLSDQLASPPATFDAEGIYLKFPTDAQPTTYQVLDPALRATRAADFIDSTRIEGREVMHYRQTIDNENVATLFAGPLNTTTFTAEDGSTSQGYLFHNATRDFWVDQKTGLIVDMSESIDNFYGTRDGRKVDQVLLFDASLPQDQVSTLVQQAADVPDGSVARTANLIVLILGVILALIGAAGSFGLFSRANAKSTERKR